MCNISNENKNLCSKCKGRCCNTLPGIYAPEDLFNKDNISEKDIISLLNEGKTSIDRWESEEDFPTQYFLRPKALKKYPGETYSSLIMSLLFNEVTHDKDYKIDLDLDQKNRYCIYLTKGGCSLEFNKRPLECRSLIPNYPETCYYDILQIKNGIPAKYYFASKWSKYNDLLEHIVNKMLYMKECDL